MSLFEIIGLLAGIAQIIGYVWYTIYVVRNIIKPNTGSWSIWAYGNAIICWNYIFLTNGNFSLTFKETLPVVCSVCCLLVAILFFFLRKLEKPKLYEVIIFIVDLCITVYWILTGETKVTHILLQISVGISFIPIIRETIQDPTSERSGPWFVWSIAYVMFFISELSTGNFWLWLFPLQYFVWCFLMALISRYYKPIR